MGLFGLPAALRSANRLRVIVSVFSRHGFAGLFQQLNLGRFIPFRGRLRRHVEDNDLTGTEVWGARLASALQELGPAFIKLGQVLSSRPDLMPHGVISQLKRLQDKVPPSDADAVRLHIERELGGPVERFFHKFDWTPFGGGSIAQVHFATAKDGEDLVVKVRRPGIDRILRADGALLGTLAGMLERHVPESRVYRPMVIADEFVRSCEQELDFVGEAAATNRFGQAFKDNPHIVIPRVRWDLTRAGLLALSRLRGRNVSNPEALIEFAVDRKAVAGHLLDAFIHQYFRMGLFHGDPHPGNLMALGPERVALLDFGLVGHLSDDMRDRLVTALLAALERELGIVVQVFGEMGSLSEDTDVEELKSDLQKLLDKYYGLNLGRFALDRMFQEITELCRRHQVILPRDFILIIKSLITIAGVGMSLDPELDLVAMLQPRLRTVLLEKVNPLRIGRKMLLSLWNMGNLAIEAPGLTGEILRKAARGKFTLQAKMPAVESMARSLEKTGNRLTLGLLTAAGLVSGAMLLSRGVPPLIRLWFSDDPISLPGLIAFAVCGLSTLMLMRGIYNSGRLS